MRTQTLKFRFLYVTDSTLKPIVGIVVTTSPIWSPCQLSRSLLLAAKAIRETIPLICTEGSSFLHCPKNVVSAPPIIHRTVFARPPRWTNGEGWCCHTRPRIRIRISFLAQRMLDSHETPAPMFVVVAFCFEYIWWVIGEGARSWAGGAGRDVATSWNEEEKKGIFMRIKIKYMKKRNRKPKSFAQ